MYPILISIIIPVYNVDHYLRECVQSVVKQGDFGGRYEIILIDDGSTDASGQICDDFARQYPFIHVNHQKNVGLGAARNFGIRSAVGKYMLFLDADDFIGMGSLGRILKEIRRKKADIFFLDSYKFFGNCLQAMNDDRLKRAAFLNKEGCMKLLGELSKYPGSAGDKLIRRELILHHHIFFEEKVFSEDLIWVLKCLLYAQTYGYLHVGYYYYRQNRIGSITNSCSSKRFSDQIHVIWQGIAVAESLEGKYFQKEIYSMMAYEVEIALLLLGMLSEKEVWHLEMVKDVLWLLRYRKVRRTKWIRWLVWRIGAGKTAVLLKWAYNIYSEESSMTNQFH